MTRRATLRTLPSVRQLHGRVGPLVLAAILVGSGCGASTPSPSASPSTAAASPSSVPFHSLDPSVAPSAAPIDPLLNAVAVTVSDRLRVRSKPLVSDDSIKYEPVLPLGTELLVVGGPISGSGFTWYEVEPVSFLLEGGVTRGWVAMAGKDGEPWIALAESPIAGLEVATSSVARAKADPKSARKAAASINALAVDLYLEMLRDPKLDVRGKNAVFSPTSIALALGMARAGARGDTATEMDGVLHTAGWDELGGGLNALDQALASRNSAWQNDEGRGQLALRIANSAFAQRGWSIEQDYLDEISAAFGSGLRLVDYIADPEAAREAINAWVKRQTADRIPELLGPPDVTPATRLYLVNAVYLKAEWDQWFEVDATDPRSFTRLDGSTIKVPTMAARRALAPNMSPAYYVRGSGWQAVELGYRGANGTTPLAMTLIRPDDISAFERSLTSKGLGQILVKLDDERDRWAGPMTCPAEYEPGNCYPYDLDLFMPRFAIETRAGLAELLAGLGMPLAFDQSRADFTGIYRHQVPSDRIFVKAVIHQANIDVDEKGTEAAAATAVGMDTGGGPGPLKEITLRLDRPFLFLIRDLETGAVLFMGRVLDPSVSKGG